MVKERKHVEFFGGKKKSSKMQGHEDDYIDLVVRWKMGPQKHGFYSIFGVHIPKKKMHVTNKTSEMSERVS